MRWARCAAHPRRTPRAFWIQSALFRACVRFVARSPMITDEARSPRERTRPAPAARACSAPNRCCLSEADDWPWAFQSLLTYPAHMHIITGRPPRPAGRGRHEAAMWHRPPSCRIPMPPQPPSYVARDPRLGAAALPRPHTPDPSQRPRACAAANRRPLCAPAGAGFCTSRRLRAATSTRGIGRADTRRAPFAVLVLRA